MSKRHPTIALVVLTVLALQGCHKSPTAPEPPEVASGGTAVSSAAGKKGGGPPSTGLVTMAGGMVSSTAQSVDIEKDSNRELRLSGPYTNAVNMSMTQAACGSGELVDILVDGEQLRFRMVMLYDRSDSGNDRLTLNFDDDDGPLERVVLNVTDGVSVTAGTTIDGLETFEFNGGSVVIKDRRGKVKDYVTVTCQNMDTITVTLDRS